jgi:hypothetical protein
MARSEPSPIPPLHLTSVSLTPDSSPHVELSPGQAEESLEFFRSRMLPCFPFIYMAPGLTAQDLRQDRPFLFKAIMTVSTFSTQKRLARADELTRDIFTSAVLKVRSSIDLLLGLLTYLAWSTDAFLNRADLLSRLMMIAISLLYDMRLFRPSPPDVRWISAIVRGFDYKSHTDDVRFHDFMDQQRALLACFVLSSKYVTPFEHQMHIWMFLTW